MSRLCLCALVLLPLAASAQGLAPSDQEVRAFTAADRNKDGMLAPPEFRLFVRAMAQYGQPTARKIRRFGAYGFAFRIVDKNRDGLAAPEELRTADDDHRAE